MISTLWRLHVGALVALLVFSHPNAFAEMMQQEYPISDVRTISVSNAAHLTIRQSSAETLLVEATEQGLNRVKVTQRGEHLTLEVKAGRAFFWSWFNRNSDDVHFIVEVRDLERLNVSGAVEVRMEELTTDAFRLDVSGASRVDIAALHTEATRAQASGASKVTIDLINTESLDITASGASRIELIDGQPIAMLTAHASGASDIHASAIPATEANVHVSGASEARVHAVDQLNVEASGASRVDYTGNPRIQQSSSGASSVRSRP